MLGANVWRSVLGVDRTTVIEGVDFDEESMAVVVHVRPRRGGRSRCRRCGARLRAMTRGKVGATGGPSILGPCSASSRPTPRG